MTKTFKITTIILIITALMAVVLSLMTRETRKPVKPVAQPVIEEEQKESTKEEPSEEVEELKAEDIDTSDWKTYVNEEYGFSFKYPGGWKLLENDGRGGYVARTDSVISLDDPGTIAIGHIDNDLPNTMVIGVYNDLTNLDFDNLGIKTLRDYLDQYAKTGDPYPLYQNVKSGFIGTKEGFVADAGPNQFGGGTSYFAQLDNSKIIKIWSFKSYPSKEEPTAAKIISTFHFLN